MADHRRRVGHDRALRHPRLDVDVRGHGPEVRRVDLGAERQQHAHRRVGERVDRAAVDRPGRSRCRPRRSRRRRRRAGRRSRPTSPAAAAAARRGRAEAARAGDSADAGCSSARGASVRYGSSERSRRAPGSRTPRAAAPAARRGRVALVEDGEEAGDVHVRHADRSRPPARTRTRTSRARSRPGASGGQRRAASAARSGRTRPRRPPRRRSAPAPRGRGRAHPRPDLGHHRLVGLVERPRTAARRAGRAARPSGAAATRTSCPAATQAWANGTSGPTCPAPRVVAKRMRIPGQTARPRAVFPRATPADPLARGRARAAC